MYELLYNFLNSDAGLIIIVVWIGISIFWIERWRPVLDRVIEILFKPSIFINDDEPKSLPLYPRSLLEEIAQNVKDTLQEPFSKLVNLFTKGGNHLFGKVYKDIHWLRAVGHLLMLLALVIFIAADAIAVANTLVVLDLWAGAVPDWLGRFDIAIFGGSLVALIIGIELVVELRSDKGYLTTLADKAPNVKSVFLAGSFLVSLMSVLSLVAWALFRLIEIGKLDASQFLEGLLYWTLYGVVPINSALAASLVFIEAVLGVVLVISGILFLLSGVLYILNYLARVLGSVGPFVIDIVYRLLYIMLDITFWFITTPVFIIRWPVEIIRNMFGDSTVKEQKKDES